MTDSTPNENIRNEAAPDLEIIRARGEALVNLFPRAVYPHRGLSDYYTIVDKWHEPIVCVTPKYLGPEAVEAARDAILAAPTDIRALLDLHDQDQARIAALESERNMAINAQHAFSEIATQTDVFYARAVEERDALKTEVDRLKNALTDIEIECLKTDRDHIAYMAAKARDNE